MSACTPSMDQLEALVPNPSNGLSEEIFLFVSGLTPIINVDLLIKDIHDRTLLTWREDGYYEAGWHVPGGIIRFKETFGQRIQAVAKSELGALVRPETAPMAINEVIHRSKRVRGHFVSLLFRCTLASGLDQSIAYRGGAAKPGQWCWHEGCPENLIQVHDMYRQFIQG